ncbi:MAG: 16S rRNA (cytosine(1402)-N(4))-methyltransferase RsmH [Bacteroidia bacterium]
MESSAYHIPVLLHDAVQGLAINPNGVYIDVTFGGGGHSKEILKHLDKGTLIAFDQDEDAQQNLIDDERFLFVPNNFSYLKNFLKLHGYSQVDGILADLGVSSHQFDVSERGFTIRTDAPLDMRMNQSGELSAHKVVNEYSVNDLTKIFREYADLPNARKIAFAIDKKRTETPINSTQELMNTIQYLGGGAKKSNQFFARVFQALRIEVNQEMEVLKTFLTQAQECLKPKGRLVVIAYHSLEDRLVKNFIRKGKFEGEVEKDFYGNPQVNFKEITRKPIVPSEKEIELNNRARSAKLRIAEKL